MTTRILLNDMLPESWLCQSKYSLTITPVTVEEVQLNCFTVDSSILCDQGSPVPLVLNATNLIGNSAICDAVARSCWNKSLFEGRPLYPKVPASTVWEDLPNIGDVAYICLGEISDRILVQHLEKPSEQWLKVMFLEFKIMNV